MFLNVNTIDSTSLSWTRSTLSHDQVTQWTKAKVRIYSDSVLCLGRCHCTKKQLQDGKVKWKILKCPFLMENYWKSMVKQLSSSGKSSQDLRHYDIDWTRKGNDENCSSKSEKSQDVREEILAGIMARYLEAYV